jgi:hypothetical protein
MGKGYRKLAVEAAVTDWEVSEWFSAEQLLPKVVESLPQRSMSVNVYSVSRWLRVMTAKGYLFNRKNGYGVMEFKRTGGDDDGSSHFYA